MATIQGLQPGSVNLNSQLARKQVQPQRKQAKGKGLLQFAVPTLGALLGGLTLGPAGALGGGAIGAAGLNLLGGGREGESPQGAALKDVLYSLAGLGAGRVAGPIIGKALGKGATKLAGEAAEETPNVLSRIGGEIRENVARPEVTKGTFFESGIKDVMKVLKKYNVKGGPRAKSRQIDVLGGKLNEDVTNLLAQHNNPVPKIGISKLITQIGQKGVAFGPEDKIFSQVTSKGASALNKAKDVQSVYAIKAAQPVSKIFAKEGAEIPVPLTPREEAIKSIWQTASDMIEKYGTPAIRTLNKEQNLISKGAIGFQKEAARTFSAPLVGGLGSGIKGGFKAGQDLLGRNLEGLGGTLGPTAGARGVMTAGAIGGAALGELPNVPNQPPATLEETTMGQEESQIPNFVPEVSDNGAQLLRDTKTGEIITGDRQYRWNPQLDDWEPIQGAEAGISAIDPQSLITQALAQAQAGNSKGAKLLLDIASTAVSAQKAGGQQLSAEQQKQIAKTTDFERALDLLETNLDQVSERGPVAGRVATGIASITGGTKFVEAADFNALRQGLIGPVARLISAEVGVLTDRDIKRADDLLPRISDSPQLALQKIQNIRILLNEKKESFSQTPSSSLENLQFPE